MCCNYFVDRFLKRKTEGKIGPLRLQGSLERDTLSFIWPETISVHGFAGGKWTSQKATQGGLCNSREKQKQGLLI